MDITNNGAMAEENSPMSVDLNLNEPSASNRGSSISGKDISTTSTGFRTPEQEEQFEERQEFYQDHFLIEKFLQSTSNYDVQYKTLMDTVVKNAKKSKDPAIREITIFNLKRKINKESVSGFKHIIKKALISNQIAFKDATRQPFKIDENIIVISDDEDNQSNASSTVKLSIESQETAILDDEGNIVSQSSLKRRKLNEKESTSSEESFKLALPSSTDSNG